MKMLERGITLQPIIKAGPVKTKETHWALRPHLQLRGGAGTAAGDKKDLAGGAQEPVTLQSIMTSLPERALIDWGQSTQ